MKPRPASRSQTRLRGYLIRRDTLIYRRRLWGEVKAAERTLAAFPR
jgi:hypothetical protein